MSSFTLGVEEGRSSQPVARVTAGRPMAAAGKPRRESKSPRLGRPLDPNEMPLSWQERQKWLSRLALALSRFVQPLIVLVASAAAFVLRYLPVWEGAGAQLVRLGTVLAIVGVLWVVALGFSLGTLRLAATVTVLLIVYLLSGIGSRARSQTEANEYLALESELAIELNLLRGTITTREDVIEQLQAAGASYQEARDAELRIGIALANLEEWNSTASSPASTTTTTRASLTTDAPSEAEITASIDHFEELLSAGLLRLEPALTPACEATVRGWLQLGLPGNPVSDRIGPPSAKEDCFEASSGGAIAPPGQPAAEGGETGNGEPADSTTRVISEQAGDLAAELEAALVDLEPALSELSTLGLDQPIETNPELQQPRLLPFLDLIALDSEQGCIDPSGRTQSEARFAAVTNAARRCISGCATGLTCEPRSAKKTILLGFQDQLVAITDSLDVSEDQAVLVARLDEIRKQLASLDVPIAIHTLANEGSDTLVGDAVQIGRADDQPTRLGGWGWLVIAICLIVAYRLLEIANDRRSPGPVKVVAGDEGQPSEQTVAAVELVKAHLASADLQEPSPLPGGEAVSSISNAAEGSRFDNAAVRFVVSLLQTTAFPPRGVEVAVTAQPDKADLLPTKDNCNQPYRLLVKASSMRRNGLRFSHPFESGELQDVTNAAAFFAAEHLLDEGWTTPSWLRWTSLDGTALWAYQEVMTNKQGPSQLRKKDFSARGRLAEAVEASPGTGAALVALSNEEMLEQNYAAALRLLLAARVRHENFLTVRYRLGVTLSMMAESITEHWTAAPRDEAHQLENDKFGAIDVLGDLDRAEGGANEWTSDRTPAEDSRRCLERAVKELDFVIDAVSVWRCLWRARRQDQRQYWLNLLRSPRRRVGLKAAAQSAKALAVRRQVLHEFYQERPRYEQPSDTVEAQLQECDSMCWGAVAMAPDDWIVRYNAACYAASLCGEYTRRHTALESCAGTAPSDHWGYTYSMQLSGSDERKLAEDWYQEAFDHLRRARHTRNGHQLAEDWVRVDPDLHPLAEFEPTRWVARRHAIFSPSVPVAPAED